MPVKFLGRDYLSPVWAASGTFGWGVEANQGAFFPEKMGALLTKGVSPQEMFGAPHPRIAEVCDSAAVLNAIGLQNPGVDKFLSKYAAVYALESFVTPVWVNVFADSISGFLEVVKKCERTTSKNSWLAGYELNVSCPNVDKGGAEFASDIPTLQSLITQIKKATSQPVMVKMSPVLQSPVDIAKACLDAGVDAISVSNTLLGALPEPETQKHALGRRYGGMSGPALKPVSLRILDQIASAISLPLCGVGGIKTAHDVKEYFSAGAQIVQVGTANFANPWIIDEICRDLDF